MVAMFVSKIKQNKLFFTSAKLTIAQASNQRLHECRIVSYTSLDSAVAQALIRRLHKRWFDDYASVKSTIVQVLS